MSTRRFADRAVFVTGAGSGLGRATAQLFAAEGARVFAVDVNTDGVRETIAAIGGGAADGGPCDVTDAGAVEAAIARAVAAFGGLDVLVNAAGIGRAARLEEIDLAEWQRVLAVNLTGPFNTTRAAMPHLLARRGNIVNVASTAGMRGQAYAAHYAASKAGLVNFTRTVALEFVSRGVRANCIAPAGMTTPIVRNFIPREDFEPSLVAYYSPPVPHRMSKPEDVAKAIAFLASDDAPMITGAVLTADWGTLA
ncbi:MAG TPA: SDR family oxidoreductase [Candidatus Binatia bacterium]|nr:SDR family oxidoreductase [Candidatus Binatia bacterium]